MADTESADPVPQRYDVGLVDTNIIILRDWLGAEDLPRAMAVSAITMAELSAGPHLVAGDDADRERARRIAILQRAEAEFEPLAFDNRAARKYGELVSAVVAYGRRPTRRRADLQIAAVAAVHDLPLFTTNPDDFAGTGDLLTVVPVARPAVAP